MTSFEALKLVTMRELTQRGRSKSYVLGAVFTLVLLGAAILLPQALGGGPVEEHVGSLGEGNDAILGATESLLRERSDPDRELTFEVTTFDSEDDARAALAEGEIELVLVDGESILRQGSAGFGGSDLQDTIQEAAGVSTLEDRLEGTGTSVADVTAALSGDPLPVRTVQGEADADLELARSLIAYGGMFLLYMAILLYGQWTLSTIAEEKASRVVEVLLATLKPWQLLAGKVIGVGLLGLAQFVVTVLWILALIRVTDTFELPAIPIDSAVSLIVWFILGYALYAVLYAGVGALVSRMEDAQSVAGPVAVIAVVGFLVSFQVLDDPSGALGRIMSFVPFTAPFVVPIRVAYAEIGIAEHLAAVAVTAAVTAVLVRIAGRIYAGGLLHFGRRLSLRQAWRSAEAR
ncbi:ABC transporter permease [Euzebya sp.]|uniref:ABC transporter permease n=1 Tax=Euzebya sp. TaxID=1971409 RepID=UPI0035115C01